LTVLQVWGSAATKPQLAPGRGGWRDVEPR